MTTSIEPTVSSWAEAQLEALGLTHGPQQNGRELDARVDEALQRAKTKAGGPGVNKPDHVIILDDGVTRVPVLCEWKGTKGRFRDQKDVELRDADGFLRYGDRGIDKYASLGAAYYASRAVGPGGHELALALAVNGYYKATSDKSPSFEVALYAVSKDDTEKVVWVGDFGDLSFLRRENLRALLEQVKDSLDPVAAKRRRDSKSQSLDAALRKLNEFLHHESQILPHHRVNVVAALMIASLGVTNRDGIVEVKPLVEGDLYGGSGNARDGALILRKVEDYLEQREPRLPIDKQQSILDALRPTLLDSSLSAKDESGDSPLKKAFRIVADGLLPYYYEDRSIDFTGRLFNEMYTWVDVPDAGANDVVLTPKRTADLMVEVTRIDSDSYVWDWTLGTGTFLVSAMNVMLADARERYQGKDLRNKENQIKVDQLLGIEKLGSIYVLAVLNMILMGDGASNIIHGDSHAYDGKYQDRGARNNAGEFFPATTLVLNPPYSAPGSGLIFVKEAFEKMNALGSGKYGAVIIQDSAGSGKAADYCRDILLEATLVASIKMPKDLFIGKSGVQTSIYVFSVGRAHHPEDLVKFVDLRNDGYRRTNRKKVKDPAVNLKPVDDPEGRYAEVAAIVLGRKRSTNYFPEGEFYFEDTIDPSAGDDWNFDQHMKVDACPTIEDFRRTVAEYLTWESAQIIRGTRKLLPGDLTAGLLDPVLTPREQRTLDEFYTVEFRDFPVGGPDGLFTLISNPQLDQQYFTFGPQSQYPYFTRTVNNNGILGYVNYFNDANLIPGNSLAVGMLATKFFYMDHDFYAGQFTKTAVANKAVLNKRTAQYFITYLDCYQRFYQSVLVRNFATAFDATTIPLPVDSEGAPNFEWVETFISAIQKMVAASLALSADDPVA